VISAIHLNYSGSTPAGLFTVAYLICITMQSNERQFAAKIASYTRPRAHARFNIVIITIAIIRIRIITIFTEDITKLTLS